MESLNPPSRQFVASALELIREHSPYLTRLSALHPQVMLDLPECGPDALFDRLMTELPHTQDRCADGASIMKTLRIAKQKVALLAGIADIAQLWPLARVTAALSEFAERSLSLTLDFLLAAAHNRGEIALPNPHAPSQESGLIVLGMGKLGGRELNYSSDIDLIIFFEQGRITYKGRQSMQHCFNRVAHDLVQIMQERTAEGYVFRTDLRLRPDPASTPPAISTEAAVYYYESVGQNWERAAMIKARPVAGDLAAGERFMDAIAPFMWRRSLDFASIQDIHSIKRQMDNRTGREIRLAGHNVKLGLGGIREIEFFAQIHQLIWGGRDPSLRLRATCDTLKQLVERKLVLPETAQTLTQGYEYLRKLEHRLQMVADEQTHTLPRTQDALESIALFMGCRNIADFEHECVTHLRAVHGIFASSFKSSEELSGAGNLVFTGVSHDPGTIETLRGMGFQEPGRVSEIVMGWHHGNSRATRTKRARELLTELMPVLLNRLTQTVNPDAAFLKFNEFLSRLPSGVQIFSLFSAHPPLLGLLADIMGSAPTLADALSKSPDLLDAVLYADFYHALPDKNALALQLDGMLAHTRSYEERMLALRRFKNEKQFQAGIHLLKRLANAAMTGRFLSDLADTVLDRTLLTVQLEFSRVYGTIAQSQFAILALGKLGSQEMTFGSDIDLVFIYDVDDFDRVSDGEKSFTASVYYNRMVQRLLHAITAMEQGGRLYEADTRLRPSGKQGLMAVSFKAFGHYFDEMAWTFEFMALTKARPVAGDGSLMEKLRAFVPLQIAKPREPEKLRQEVIGMRERIAQEFGTQNPWDVKYARGGMIDLDFIAQYLLLRHAHALGDAALGASERIFAWLGERGVLATNAVNDLTYSGWLLSELLSILRLASDGSFEEETVMPGLQALLCAATGNPDFANVKKRVQEVQSMVYKHYIALVETH